MDQLRGRRGVTCGTTWPPSCSYKLRLEHGTVSRNRLNSCTLFVGCVIMSTDPMACSEMVCAPRRYACSRQWSLARSTFTQ
jgi:hypothetical protein